jgi:hypothetical protein
MVDVVQGKHRDDRFPEAASPFACSACQRKDHDACSLDREILMSPGGDTYVCECWSKSSGLHPVDIVIRYTAEERPRVESDADWASMGLAEYVKARSLGWGRRGC